MKWYAVYSDREDDGYGESQTHTVSNVPGRHGWENDSGCEGYGLTRTQVDHIAGLSAEVEVLRGKLEKVRAAVKSVAIHIDARVWPRLLAILDEGDA